MKYENRIYRACAVLAALLLAGCGKTENQSGSPTGTLCFDYFQRCVYPLALDTPLPIDLNNDGVFDPPRRCADSGCHASGGSTGGGLRLTAGLSPVDVATTPPSAILQTEMHTTFLSAKGRANLNDPRSSALLQEPLFEVTHSGGRIFVSDQSPAAQQILFWINNRAPLGGTEFAETCANLFAPGDTCRTLP